MTPEQALAMLDKVCGSVQATREVHDAIRLATATLQRLIDSTKSEADGNSSTGDPTTEVKHDE